MPFAGPPMNIVQVLDILGDTFSYRETIRDFTLLTGARA
jgi:hypothetical protein